MFERFTERSRNVMALANQIAISHGHAMIDTEHMLLGMVKEGTGVGAHALNGLLNGDFNLSKVRHEVERRLPADGPAIKPTKLPQTPAAKAVILFAMEEAQLLNHQYVGTEHFLLGMLRQADGRAGQALTNLGVTLDTARMAVRQILGQEPEASEREEPTRLIVTTPVKSKPWWRIW